MIGLGTALDTARFRSLIAEALKLPPTQVTALILGEHGDSMVPIWSAAQAAGCPWRSSPAGPRPRPRRSSRGPRASGAEVIKLKGGAGFAVGMSIREVVHAVALDSRRILPVSSLVERTLRHPRRLHLGPDRGRPRRRRGPARDRALAQGSLGAPALGPGASRDDRPGPEEQPQGRRKAPGGTGSAQSRLPSQGRNARTVRVTMGAGRTAATPGVGIAGHRLGAGPGQWHGEAGEMIKSLDRKLAAIHADPNCREFILADAKDADMALGLGAPGQVARDCTPARSGSRRSRNTASRCG